MNYNTLINGYCKAGRFEKAEELLKKMKSDGLRLDEITYTTLIDGYSKAEKFREAEDLLEKMRSEGPQPNAKHYTALIGGYAKAGKLQDAEKLFKKMTSLGVHPENRTYNTLIDGYTKAGKLGAAESVFQDMRQAGISPDEIAYGALINGYAKLGRLKVAEDLFEEMKRAGLRPHDVIYSIFIDSYFTKNDFERANFFFRKSDFFTNLLQPVLNGTSQKLDLHELSHNVACIAILLFSESTASQVDIVHGIGRHSEYEPYAMKKRVLGFIEKERLPLKAEAAKTGSAKKDEGTTRLVRVPKSRAR